MNRRELFGAAAVAALGLRARQTRAPSRAATTAAPVPSPAQLAWQRAELAMFVHFGINTFTNREWGDGREDPRIFNPSALDARQWVRAAKQGGFRTIILTAKHHDGFCLWPTATTEHSVRASPWRGGSGDVVRQLADACRAERLGLGLYLSPWDRHEPSYGDSPRYNDVYERQLTELLTGYGPLVEVWFDGANGEGPNGKRQVYDWPRIHRTVRRHQPSALIFSDAGPDIRWIGNERGVAGDPNWCMVDPAAVPYPGMSGDHIIRSLQHGDEHGTVWRPGEADVSIRPGWFWHPEQDGEVRSALDLEDLYYSSVGRNAGLLLNVPPTADGRLHANDVRALAGFAARLESAFAPDLATEASAQASAAPDRTRMPVRVIEEDPDSYWQAPASPAWVELEWPRPIDVGMVSVQEAIAHGQSVQRHRVELWQGTEWHTVARGSTIGYRRIHRFARASTTRVRLVIDAAREAPKISRFAIFDGRS